VRRRRICWIVGCWRGLGGSREFSSLFWRDLYGCGSGANSMSYRDNNEGVASFLEKRPVKFTGTLKDNAPGVFPWWAPVDTRGVTRPVAPKSSKL